MSQSKIKGEILTKQMNSLTYEMKYLGCIVEKLPGFKQAMEEVNKEIDEFEQQPRQ